MPARTLSTRVAGRVAATRIRFYYLFYDDIRNGTRPRRDARPGLPLDAIPRPDDRWLVRRAPDVRHRVHRAHDRRDGHAASVGKRRVVGVLLLSRRRAPRGPELRQAVAR